MALYVGGTGDANKLDDYEEGSWTPQWTSASGGPPNHQSQAGKYVKIGNMVYVIFSVSMNGINGGSGNIGLSGLPFSAQTLNAQGTRGGFGTLGRGYNAPSALSHCVASGTTVRFLLSDHTDMLHNSSGMGTGYNECQISGTITYNITIS